MTKSFVDRAFVKAKGAMAAHEIDGLDALYPELFDQVAAAVSARFAGRAVSSGQVEIVRSHVAALIVAELQKHLGTRRYDADFIAMQNAEAAEDWLAKSTSLNAARASAPPLPSALSEATEPLPLPAAMPGPESR